MEYIKLIQNGESKMADDSRFYFNNRRRHYDITVIVKVITVSANFLLCQTGYFCLWGHKMMESGSAKNINSMIQITSWCYHVFRRCCK